MSDIVKGYLTTRTLRSLKDGMTFPLLERILDQYIENYTSLNKINEQLRKKKCRHDNFPSHISENITKFAIYAKYRIMPNWDVKPGDLDLIGRKIEVKGYSSDGPTSFGPSESWDWIYFVDCRHFAKREFIVYEIRLSNRDDKWKHIQMTKQQTYDQISQSNRRGQLRACFEKIIKPQLKDDCRIIFKGSLQDLANSFSN